MTWRWGACGGHAFCCTHQLVNHCGSCCSAALVWDIACATELQGFSYQLVRRSCRKNVSYINICLVWFVLCHHDITAAVLCQAS
jgi:hypothetical protein